MVAKGEMNTDEARRFVEDMMKQAQQPQSSGAATEKTPPAEPRRIEIVEEDEAPTAKNSPTNDVDGLRNQVIELQEELKRLQRND
jgi:polyhydroxyalkanoate synthesis regulator phasin